jgi:hypothetical protein
MPAALGKNLVLDLNTGGPGSFVASYCALDVEQSAEAGIGIANNGRRRSPANLCDAFDHLAIGRKTGIG